MEELAKALFGDIDSVGPAVAEPAEDNVAALQGLPRNLLAGLMKIAAVPDVQALALAAVLAASGRDASAAALAASASPEDAPAAVLAASASPEDAPAAVSFGSRDLSRFQTPSNRVRRGRRETPLQALAAPS